jgi:general stress protein 26
MTRKTLAEISDAMSRIDFVMLQTKTGSGQIAGRPMSNNGDVAYEGTSFYFTREETRMVGDITRDPEVALAFQANKSLLGAPGIMIAVQGIAELIRDRAAFDEHWNPDLDRWFEDGADTPGLVMIAVRASRIHYWDGEEEGELEL